MLAAALQATRESQTAKHLGSKNSGFAHWTEYCEANGLDPSLSGYNVPQRTAVVLAYGQQYREWGKWSPGRPKRFVRAGTVVKALTSVGSGFTNLGLQDPRKDEFTNALLPAIREFQDGLRKMDSPASRVYPVGLQFIRHLPDILDFDHSTEGTINQHIVNLTIVGFFWLLRPCEFLRSPEAHLQTKAFQLKDISFTYRGRQVSAPNASFLNDVRNWRHIHDAALMFTEQKNGVKGEIIRQRATNHDFLCPAKALAWIVRHMLKHRAGPDTYIYSHWCAYRKYLRPISYDMVTTGLRLCAEELFSSTGIKPSLLTVKGLRPGGATALLCAGVDSNATALLGRWRSDAMLRYLRAQAAAYTNHYSQLMLDSGSYTFTPQSFSLDGLPDEASQDLREANALYMLTTPNGETSDDDSDQSE